MYKRNDWVHNMYTNEAQTMDTTFTPELHMGEAGDKQPSLTGTKM